jgi:hypothetical protein
LLRSGMSALACVGRLRAALADANGKFGVSSLLSEAEDKRAQARALEGFAHIDLATTTPVSEANEALNRRAGEKSSLSMLRGLRVALVPVDSLDFVGEQKRALDAQAAALSDQVADINRQTLTLELDEDLAKSVGL